MATKKNPKPGLERESVKPRVRLSLPVYWSYRKIAAIATIPLIVIACILAWAWIPMSEARYQQKELAHEFFNQCTIIFTDTSQIPKVPEEALHIAQHKQSVTLDALRAWSPQVLGEIRDGYWWARIQFGSPEKKVYEQRIGVAVNDVGYNTPSERAQRQEGETSEP
jgi:hypothetical protein